MVSVYKVALCDIYSTHYVLGGISNTVALCDIHVYIVTCTVPVDCPSCGACDCEDSINGVLLRSLLVVNGWCSTYHNNNYYQWNKNMR